MKKPTHILFDADGVLTLPEDVFSVIYARSRDLDIQTFRDFFKNDWPAIVTGKKDLKESIAENPELWKWEGTTDELLAYWFEVEDVRNEQLMNYIKELKSQRVQCFLATDQEHHRANYMKNVMFKDLFADHFVSAELGVIKASPLFFEKTLNKLRESYPNLTPGEVIFFDDSQAKVDSAKEAGIDARLFKSNSQVRELLE